MINMQSITIEQYLDNLKRTSDQLIKEVEANHITTQELKSLFLEKSEEMKVEREKFENILINIELLFDVFPDEEYKTLFINHFDELSKLEGRRFESWLNGIKFTKEIEDDLKISYLCNLYDFEIVQWITNAIKVNKPNQRQTELMYLQIYLDLVEGFYSKILNILIYAMIKTSKSGILVVDYPNGRTKELKNYKNVSNLELFGKLLVLQSDLTYKELSVIAKVCNKDLRNAVAHHSYKLNETEQKIEFERGQLLFDKFIETALELVEYRIILVECFRYYSTKCYFESKGLLKK